MNILCISASNVEPAKEHSAGEKGVAFGIRELHKPTDSIFVTITHDWGAIRQRLTPLVKNVLGAL